MNINKPYIYFWVTSLLLILIGYKTYIDIGDSTLDINIHDTYFVISHYNFFKVFAFLFAIIGVLYWVYYKTNTKLIKLLVNTHIILSIGCFLIYIFGKIYFGINKNEFPLFDDHANENTFTIIMLFIFILVQFIFFINVIVSGIKYLFSKS